MRKQILIIMYTSLCIIRNDKWSGQEWKKKRNTGLLF